MRILFTPIGSLGDLHPYIAIAFELQSLGHEVRFATGEPYREKLEGLGFDFRAVRPKVEPSPELIERVIDLKKGPEVLFEELIFGPLRETYEDTFAAAADTNAIVTHPLAVTGRLVAEKRNLAWISSVLAPISLFSAIDSPVYPGPAFLEWLRILPAPVHRALLRLGKLRFRKVVQPWHDLRRELDLPPAGHPMFEAQFSPRLNLALFSKALASPQADWPANSQATGFCFYDGASFQDRLSPQLEDFLNDGPPPVVFSLGSSAVMAAGDFYDIALEAAQRADVRAILLKGEEVSQPGREFSSGVIEWDYAPYSLLFPRASLVVVSAGIGTVSQALRAGTPMILVPISYDQFDNASRLRRLGVAHRIHRKRLTPPRLAAGIRKALDDPELAQNARNLGAIIARERGARAAAEAIVKAAST